MRVVVDGDSAPPKLYHRAWVWTLLQEAHEADVVPGREAQRARCGIM